LKRNAVFPGPKAEQRIPSARWVNGALLGNQQPDARLSADSFADAIQQWQPAAISNSAIFFDQPGFLHLIGHLGDDDLVAATAGVLVSPLAANPEAAAPVL